MARIRYIYRGKSASGNLTIRLYHTKEIDIRVSSPIISKRNYWIKPTTKNGKKVIKHRGLKDLSNLSNEAKIHKEYLEGIQSAILNQFLIDYNNGIPITSQWLKSVITENVEILTTKNDIDTKQDQIEASRIKEIEYSEMLDFQNRLTTAIQNVIDTEYYDNPNLKKIYGQVYNKLISYQKLKNKIVCTSDVNQFFINKYTSFLIGDCKHTLKTANKHCSCIKHATKYHKSAYRDIVEVAEDLEQIRFKKLSKSKNRKLRDRLVVTLSFDELDRIFETDVPDDLIDAKKVLLFGSEVGLRFSDFEKLTNENITVDGESSYWEFYNKKTGSDVIIPITKRILKYIKEFGYPKTSFVQSGNVILNRQVKDVCKLAGITSPIEGSRLTSIELFGEKVQRKVDQVYPKYELISLHALRRTFATNYFGILPNHLIRQVTGHSTDKQLMEYVNMQENKVDIAKQIADTVNELHSKRRNKNHNFKVIRKGA